MKLIVTLLIGMFLATTVHAQNLTESEQKEAILHNMLINQMSQCQAAIGFMTDQFVGGIAVNALTNAPIDKQTEVGAKLSKDFRMIEDEIMPQIEKYYTDRGISGDNIKRNAAMVYVMYHNEYHRQLLKLPHRARPEFVQNILGYVSICTTNAQWMVDTFVD